MPELLSYSFPGYNDFLLDTFLTEQFLEQNILFSSRFYPTYAHSEKHLNIFEKKLTQILDDIGDNPSTEIVSSKIKGSLKTIKLS